MQQRGFTLIELLVVVAIITFIATIIIVSLNNASTKGRDGRRLSDAKQLQNALQLYFDAYTQYPATLASLAPDYIPEVPRDPVNAVDYAYDLTPGGASYHLGLNLERADSDGLKSDADIVTATVNGSDTGNCAGVTSVGRYCYDVVP